MRKPDSHRTPVRFDMVSCVCACMRLLPPTVHLSASATCKQLLRLCFSVNSSKLSAGSGQLKLPKAPMMLCAPSRCSPFLYQPDLQEPMHAWALTNGTHLAQLSDLHGLCALAPAFILVKLHLSCLRCTHHCVFCSGESGNCVATSIFFSLAIA